VLPKKCNSTVITLSAAAGAVGAAGAVFSDTAGQPGMSLNTAPAVGAVLQRIQNGPQHCSGGRSKALRMKYTQECDHYMQFTFLCVLWFFEII